MDYFGRARMLFRRQGGAEMCLFDGKFTITKDMIMKRGITVSRGIIINIVCVHSCIKLSRQIA